MGSMSQQLHETYINQRLASGTAAISDTIKKSSICTFAKRPDSKTKYSKITSLKRDTSLDSRLFISIQSRPDFDLNDFFRFENQREPPSLSNQGRLRSGKKSDILTCLSISKVLPPHDISVKILDGASVVHMVRPTKADDFQQYVSRHFMPYITRTVCASTTPSTRLDIVFDTYPENSLTAQAQSKRSTTGATTIVEGSTPLPQDLNKFLANQNNKMQLFQFLSKSVLEVSHTLFPNVVVYSKNDDMVIASSDAVDLSGISPCNHQEADSRIFLHLSDAAQQGHSKAMIRTVDSDIFVIAVAQFRQLSFTELWMAFATGKNFINVPVHDIAQHLGPQKSLSLPFFHALSGCDTTSALLGIGKRTAWAAWEAYPELSETLVALTEDPNMLTIDSVHMERLERSMDCRHVRQWQWGVHESTRPGGSCSPRVPATHPSNTGSPVGTYETSSSPGRVCLEAVSKATTGPTRCLPLGIGSGSRDRCLVSLLDAARGCQPCMRIAPTLRV